MVPISVNRDELYHFSTNPDIKRFVPHVPRTNPTHRAAVWAIDADHAPLYWFPRDCPRVSVWPRGHVESGDASGQWISERGVVPVSVAMVGDLLAVHPEAGIELRVVPSLWPLHDEVKRGEFDFSIVRMHNARPRPQS
jgi:hypothetical protein